MFSQTVEYALRAMVFLASQEPGACTTDQVARATRVPRAYLCKVLRALSRAGLMHTSRGVGGGVSLTRSPRELTLLEVVNAVDPMRRINTCPLGLASHGVRLCPLHAKLDNAMSMVEEAFGSTTLADLLESPNPSKPLCDALPLRLA